MQSNIYINLSAQMALQKRLDTLANNMANVTTAGFRGEEVEFEQILSSVSKDPIAYVSAGTTHLSQKAGELTETGNPLDIAVRGQAWFAYQGTNGIVYTRDGRMQMTPEGELQTVTGRPFLDAGGAPLQIDPNAGPPTINSNGAIVQNGQQLGVIGLYRMDPAAQLTRVDGSGVLPDRPPIAELDNNVAGVVQGFIEKSNINPVLEMTRLIGVQRSFEAVTNAVRDNETSMQDVLKMLSGA
jgi:flagellar basal-body rod protein FlgF